MRCLISFLCLFTASAFGQAFTFRDIVAVGRIRPAAAATVYDLPQTNKLYLVLHYKDLSDGAVSSWTDRIQSRVFSQGTGGKQPTKSSTGITFDGSNDELTATPFTVPAGSIIYFCIKPTSAAGAYQTIFGSDNKDFYVNAGKILKYGDGDADISIAVSSTTYDVVFSGTNSAAGTGNTSYTNGVAAVSGIQGYGASWTDAKGIGGHSATEFFTGDILCLVIWTNANGFTATDATNCISWRMSQ